MICKLYVFFLCIIYVIHTPVIHCRTHVIHMFDTVVYIIYIYHMCKTTCIIQMYILHIYYICSNADIIQTEQMIGLRSFLRKLHNTVIPPADERRHTQHEGMPTNSMYHKSTNRHHTRTCTKHIHIRTCATNARTCTTHTRTCSTHIHIRTCATNTRTCTTHTRTCTKHIHIRTCATNARTCTTHTRTCSTHIHERTCATNARTCTTHTRTCSTHIHERACTTNTRTCTKHTTGMLIYLCMYSRVTCRTLLHLNKTDVTKKIIKEIII